jgi:hypothetical protein
MVYGSSINEDHQGPLQGRSHSVSDEDAGSMGAAPSFVAQEVPCDGICGQEGQADYKDAGRTAARRGGVGGGKPWFSRGEGEDTKEVMWNPDFYEQFAFILDAGTCTDAKGPANVKEKGLRVRNRFYPPEEHRPGKGLDTKHDCMWYVVIHKHEGIVVGSDIMYWGSTRSNSSKGGPHHSSDFPHWCASSYCL